LLTVLGGKKRKGRQITNPGTHQKANSGEDTQKNL
jgi:hypothetical protein